MDPVIFTGRVTLEELKHDKPREYERMVESGELEKHLVDPCREGVERGFRDLRLRRARHRPRR